MKDEKMKVFPCGVLDTDTGKVIDRFTVKEMTGKEEDLLASRNVPLDKKMDEILTNCITKMFDKDEEVVYSETKDIEAAVKKLTVADRSIAILALRIISIDEWFRMQTTCPACNVRFRATVNLNDLPVIEMKDKEKILKNEGVYERQLPSGKSVKLKVMTREISERLRQQIESNDRDSLTLAILARVVNIDGKKQTIPDVKGLGIRERNFLRQQFNEIEGGLDTNVDCTCPNCQNKFTVVLDVGQPDFFFPSGL